MTEPIKPGTDNRRPGHYHEVGPRGGKVSGGHAATIQKGDRLPPTSKPGNGWKKG
ncbi:YjzC family protein [Pediococcus inopinatus]|uniref:YjzC family protein n=1 Tax=Pediococcus inopinatus TaxID=114090 RepID=A0ABZ0Q2P9_9LACO|nr:MULTISPECIES: YjzC family protein [Pediococcus]MCT4397670.1 YjzC family protein [Pediococcus ethanolidurans]WPC20883.1 YjzC family protein [Pediococcus inopinatus]